MCCDSSDHPGVDSSGQIEKFQEKALMELQDYVQKTYPDDTYRYISNTVSVKFNPFQSYEGAQQFLLVKSKR